ncbi:MAG: tRNA preQ1(34) S-adenosylmethionine ribosyltransferase-isomerase QueA [Desulfurivibrio sp.]|nr:tRNA preQ1(34) S-adenosylmethionine ribosyltransferase-isomerase QueA [Desulfurivibrio sp.]
MSDDSPYSLSDYDYHLPPELIAQQPAARRDASRLLVCDCRSAGFADRHFPELLDLLSHGDLLVFNDTRVFPARLLGRKASGGRGELLLLEYPVALAAAAGAGNADGGAVTFQAWALFKSSKGPKEGLNLLFGDDLQAEILELGEGGKVRVRLQVAAGDTLDDCLARHGRMPLPPYIQRPEAESPEDRQRYQTVYAAVTGAVAAPTAGLHFTPELLAAIAAKGVRQARVTLHVGYGTFAPVRTSDIREHAIHGEYYAITPENVALVEQTRAAGGRIWAVGTTAVRALETAAGADGYLTPGSGVCELYIYPGYRFKVVDNLLTNFHLPKSSLLFLVSALAGRRRIMAAYNHAVARGYRFFSYGDAMAIITR